MIPIILGVMELQRFLDSLRPQVLLHPAENGQNSPAVGKANDIGDTPPQDTRFNVLQYVHEFMCASRCKHIPVYQYASRTNATIFHQDTLECDIGELEMPLPPQKFDLSDLELGLHQSISNVGALGCQSSHSCRRAEEHLGRVPCADLGRVLWSSAEPGS